MVRAFCTSGNNEALKCAVHGAAGLLVGVCAAYNITASCFRRDRPLRINAVVYTLAVASTPSANRRSSSSLPLDPPPVERTCTNAVRVLGGTQLPASNGITRLADVLIPET